MLWVRHLLPDCMSKQTCIQFSYRSCSICPRAAVHSGARLDDLTFEERIPVWDYKGTTHLEEMVLITQSTKEVQMIMSNYVGIVRSDIRLERAMVRLDILYEERKGL